LWRVENIYISQYGRGETMNKKTETMIFLKILNLLPLLQSYEQYVHMANKISSKPQNEILIEKTRRLNYDTKNFKTEGTSCELLITIPPK
jgi:hypothetical protein